jgi:hypothetical protein
MPKPKKKEQISIHYRLEIPVKILGTARFPRAVVQGLRLTIADIAENYGMNPCLLTQCVIHDLFQCMVTAGHEGCAEKIIGDLHHELARLTTEAAPKGKHGPTIN